MPQKAQGTTIQVASAAGATDAITAITNANPGVVTSTSHGNANGSVGVITGVVGMTQLNNRAFIVANTATNTLELKGVDTSTTLGYGVYSSGGVWTPQTMVNIGECRSIGPGFDGEASEIDTTHLASTAKEYLLGLQDFGNYSLSVFMPSPNDTGQTRLRTLKAMASPAAFLITLPSGQSAAFMALVKSFAIDAIEPDGTVQASINLRVTGEPSFFA